MKKILILCTGNSCRSQMAEGWLRHFAGDKAEVHSAGVEAHGLNPRAVTVMKEADIDISHHTSKTLDAVKHHQFDIVLTVCDHARERCPYFPAKVRQVHHDFLDPARVRGTEEEIMKAFRAVRDQIKKFSQAFVIAHLR